MFGAGPGDPHDIGLLKGIVSNQGGGNLTGEDDDGDRVHVGRCNPCHCVGGARSGGDHHHSHLPGGTGIAVCRMDSRLFMADKNLAERGAGQFVEERKDSSSRVVEEGVHSFLLQTFNDNLGTGLLHLYNQLEYWNNGILEYWV